MAKILIVCASLLAAAAASHLPGHFVSSQPQAPSTPGYVASVRSIAEASAFENTHNGDGSYRYSYESPESSVHESGAPRAVGPSGAAVTAEGAFSYRAPDGQQVSLTYTADENGFHPVGSHIPTPPPIPEAILRSLQLIAQNPQNNEGAYHPQAQDNDSEVVYSAAARSGYKY